MKIGLVLTNDWELFGDGSGDFFDIQYHPMIDLLKTVNENNAKITLMAEVGQQWGYKKLSQEYAWAKEASEKWEETIKKTLLEGNDVQLHLHPQWFNFEYLDNRIQLDMDKCSLTDYPESDIENYISKGKEYLESLLSPIAQDYKCIAFRAGAYYIEPSNKIICRLINTGILCDTSVTKGIKSKGHYDFTNAFSNIIPWFIDNESINKRSDSKNDLLEMPIYSNAGLEFAALKKLVPKLYYLLKYNLNVSNEELMWANERDKIKSVRYPVQNRFYKKSEKKNLKFYLSAMMSYSSIQLDYDYIPSSVFLKILKNILREKDLQKYFDKGVILPVVASGHIKDAHNNDNLRKILEGVNTQLNSDISFWTLSEATNYWLDYETSNSDK